MKAAAQAVGGARRCRLVTVAVGERPRRDGTVHDRRRRRRASPIDRLDDDGLPPRRRRRCSASWNRTGASAWRGSFPALRPKVFNALIEETARANAGYAFSTGLAEIVPILDIPLNIGDIVVLTKNQLMMSYRIALAAGKTGEPRELIGEIVGVLGGGLLFRQARATAGRARSRRSACVPKVAVAYGGTWAIGRAVVLWATGGGTLTRRPSQGTVARRPRPRPRGGAARSGAGRTSSGCRPASAFDLRRSASLERAGHVECRADSRASVEVVRVLRPEVLGQLPVRVHRAVRHVVRVLRQELPAPSAGSCL